MTTEAIYYQPNRQAHIPSLEEREGKILEYSQVLYHMSGELMFMLTGEANAYDRQALGKGLAQEVHKRLSPAGGAVLMSRVIETMQHLSIVQEAANVPIQDALLGADAEGDE